MSARNEPRVPATAAAVQARIAAGFARQHLMTTLGATLVHVEDGEVHIALPFSTGISQHHGYVHAGAIASVLDTACGFAGLTRGPDDHDIVTAEFKINLLRPAIGERFLAIGRVVNAGRLLAVCAGEVQAFRSDAEAPKVVAVMQATMAYVKG